MPDLTYYLNCLDELNVINLVPFRSTGWSWAENTDNSEIKWSDIPRKKVTSSKFNSSGTLREGGRSLSQGCAAGQLKQRSVSQSGLADRGNDLRWVQPVSQPECWEGVSPPHERGVYVVSRQQMAEACPVIQQRRMTPTGFHETPLITSPRHNRKFAYGVNKTVIFKDWLHFLSYLNGQSHEIEMVENGEVS